MIRGLPLENRTRDVKKYVGGCLICQQQKVTSQKKFLTDPTPVDVPTRRWGSLATGFCGTVDPPVGIKVQTRVLYPESLLGYQSRVGQRSRDIATAQ